MSDNVKHKHGKALEAANEIVNLIKPACFRVEIAGSLRRQKPEVGDIEIVAIPNYDTDLFGELFYSAAIVGEILRRAGFEMDKDGDNYKKFFYVRYQIWVDLFLTTPPQFGVIHLIRTGSADFSRKMVTSKQMGGYMPSHYKVSEGRVWEGRVWSGATALETPEETDVFTLWGMKFIEPKDRVA